jgi:hypothetical protein
LRQDGPDLARGEAAEKDAPDKFIDLRMRRWQRSRTVEVKRPVRERGISRLGMVPQVVVRQRI